MELKDVKKHRMYNTKEIAAFMGLDPQTVQRYVRNGLLEAVQAHKPSARGKGKKLMFSAQHVQDYYDRLAGKKAALKVVKERVESFGSNMNSHDRR